MARASRKIEKTADNMEDLARQASESVSETVDNARGEAADLTRRVAAETAEIADAVVARLKGVGVDPDKMVSAAKDQASELQRLLADELRARPLRAIGMAAAFGLLVGLLTTR
jgi:ElaB/YqjD/DUF883 family membrane-anchored ribosome-binding protein